MRPATLDQLPDERAVLEEASAWLRTKGITQWPDQVPAHCLEPAIARTETWLPTPRYTTLHGAEVGRYELDVSEPPEAQTE
jgi:hypothetical protein